MDTNALAELSTVASILRGVDADLGHLTGRAEAEFAPVCALLGETIESLSGMTAALESLGRDLHGEEALHAVSTLSQAIMAIRDLNESTDHGSRDLLPDLAKNAEQVAHYVDLLRKIVDEINALAINGKIQAALVATAGVDFTVFTSEIGRLGDMAAAQIGQAANRLLAVRAAIGGAIEAETSFARNEAVELQNIRLRLESNIAQMAERGQRASKAVQTVEIKSREVSDRVAQTVGELQINDITCQRIEHVRTVLRSLSHGFDGAPEADWLLSLPSARLERVAAGACRLQQQQLQQAGLDYVDEITALIGNLRGLSADAGDLQAEAESAFSDSQGGLFLVEIERDVARAIALVENYDEARTHRNRMIRAVSQGFLEMTGDLDAIRSIDADMRVMGLNATLKCGRLGHAGQALGVVAQELRACSRRTEDGARMVGDLLGKSLETARQLDLLDQAGSARKPADSLATMMVESVAELGNLSASMSEILNSLRRDAPVVAGKLSEGADSIAFQHRLEQGSDRSFARIGDAIDLLAAAEDLTVSDYEDIRRLVEPLYTMDSERLIHRQFDGLAIVETAAVDSIDTLFF